MVGPVAYRAVGRSRGQIRLVLDFVNRLKSEADPEQLVLFTDGPYAGKAKALAQLEHGLKALDGAPGRVEGLKAADPGHVLLDPEVVALNALLQMFGDVVG